MRNVRLSLLLGLLFAFGVTPRAQPYFNLALEGGGVRGLAYAGCIEELQQRGLMDCIQNVAGTSAGAIAGCLISVGYTSEELKVLLADLNVQNFNDGKWFFLGGQARLRREYGWYRGDALEDWMEEIIYKKTNIRHLTFMQLHQLKLTDRQFRDLYVTACNLSQQKLAVFGWQDYPNMEIATAVRVSASIPLYFRAVKLDSLGHKSDTGDVFVDGGFLINYPLTLFDSGRVNPHSLGLKLERPEQIAYSLNDPGFAPYEITDLKSYMGALYTLTLESINRKMPIEDERSRTIYISTAGIAPRARTMNREQKEVLYENGRRAARAFFSEDSNQMSQFVPRKKGPEE
jgi:NTE family protein